MSEDVRGWRIALVPDALLNPPQERRSGLPDLLGTLEKAGYGVLQLPPEGEHRLLLAVIADQIAEYAHHGYAVVAIGVRGEPGYGLHWRRLASLLRRRGVAPPHRLLIDRDADGALEQQRLAAELADYDIAAPEQKRWRF